MTIEAMIIIIKTELTWEMRQEQEHDLPIRKEASL